VTQPPLEEPTEPVGAPEPGKVELLEEDHEAHGAGGLYVPDLSAIPRWSYHRVPSLAPERPSRRLGFGRDR
jgi:hypothetical protein